MKSLPFSLALLGLAATSYGAPVILNEYNAVDPTKFAAPVPGDWFEIVVVGGGIAGDTVDMRGWEFRIDELGIGGSGFNAGRFQLSSAPYWSAVQAGTIITFHEDNAAAGGRNTSILGVNNFATEGWAHTNIWVQDPTYINTSFAAHDPNYPMTENNMQITILRAGTTVFGPAGENAMGGLVTVGDDEVFKLEANPSTSITATSTSYNDGSSSSFGAPNVWGSATVPERQDFSAFIIPEPSSLLLAGAAGIGLLTMRRRRR